LRVYIGNHGLQPARFDYLQVLPRSEGGKDHPIPLLKLEQLESAVDTGTITDQSDSPRDTEDFTQSGGKLLVQRPGGDLVGDQTIENTVVIFTAECRSN
jgi:hypothetical protein